MVAMTFWLRCVPPVVVLCFLFLMLSVFAIVGVLYGEDPPDPPEGDSPESDTSKS